MYKTPKGRSPIPILFVRKESAINIPESIIQMDLPFLKEWYRSNRVIKMNKVNNTSMCSILELPTKNGSSKSNKEKYQAFLYPVMFARRKNIIPCSNN